MSTTRPAEHPARVIVAILPVAGTWTRAVCRTGRCEWAGPARPERWLVEHDQNSHRREHLAPGRRR